MSDQDDIRREIERQLAVEEAAKASEKPKRSFFSRSAPHGSAATGTETVQAEKVQGGGILDRFDAFTGSISAEAARRRIEFEPPVIEGVAEETNRVKKAGWLRRQWQHAAHAVAHNPVSDAVFRNRISRGIGAGFSWTNHMLGRPGGQHNLITEKTVSADFVAQAVGVVLRQGVLYPAARAIGRGLHILHDEMEIDRLASDKRLRGARMALGLGKFVWKWGGGAAAAGFYHWTCCYKTPRGKHHFSPLAVVNTAGWAAFYAAGCIVAPIVTAPLIEVAAPFYYKATEGTARDVIVMGKHGPDADEVFQISIATKEEIADAKARRRKGESVDDDEIGRRFDVEQILMYGIENPYGIANMIPTIGHCDAIDYAGWFIRTPRVKIGTFRLIRAHVWLAPLVRGTQGCMPFTGGVEGSREAPVFDQRIFANMGHLPVDQQADVHIDGPKDPTPVKAYGTAAAKVYTHG
jgi:hypothetical protein